MQIKGLRACARLAEHILEQREFIVSTSDLSCKFEFKCQQTYHQIRVFSNIRYIHPTPETLIFEIDIFLGNYDLAMMELPNILGGDTMMAKLLEPDSAVSCRVNFRLIGI